MNSLGSQIVWALLYGFQGTTLIASQFAETSRKMRRPNDDADWEGLLVVLSSVLLVLVALILSYRLHQRWKRAQLRDPKALFRELCRAHRLKRQSIRLLLELARCRQLKHPALVFVEVQHFAPAGLSNSLKKKFSDLDELRRNIFATE